jgi:hypothetical protein
MISELVRIVRVEDGSEKYFDNVARMRLDGAHVSLVADMPKDLAPCAGRGHLVISRGHEGAEMDSSILVARGIVGRKDEQFVAVSCGGMIWLVESRALAQTLEIEDLVTFCVRSLE